MARSRDERNLPTVSTNSRELAFSLNGEPVSVADDGASLLETLRDRLGIRSPKDGCSPQGQCGCCTVLVDGQPRVACVTPTRRVRGRDITTIEGLDDAAGWASALCSTGGSQCGFCTPGIVLRLAGARAKHGTLDPDRVRESLKAHLCRCTGWQTIVEAAVESPAPTSDRDLAAAERRAGLEGGVPQTVSPAVALGAGGFADDSAPADALVAVRGPDGAWVVADTLAGARAAAGKIQGRRTTVEPEPPVAVPDGDWDLTLQTNWVDPGYLETDASWCEPGGEPVSSLGNGGAFGGKTATPVGAVARELADRHGRPVRALFSREDVVRLGSKRPPLAAGVRADGSGRIAVARTTGVAEAIAEVAPGFEVGEVDLEGPPTSCAVRAAGWAEAAILFAASQGTDTIRAANGAVASATVTGDSIAVTVRCGDPLDEVVLRSYCIGAAHMGFSWVTSEALVVSEGEVHDLTVRSLGIVRAVDMPHVEVTIGADDGPPINGSDAVFAAVALATWRARDFAPVWPTG